MILYKKSKEVVDEGNFGSIVLIATILSIMVSSIRLYQLCKSSDAELYQGFKHVGLAEKIVLNRQIKKEAPSLNREDRKKLLNLIVQKAGEVNWEEFKNILEEVKKNG